MRVWNPRLELGGLDGGATSRKRRSCSGRATARSTSASGPSTSRPFRAEHPDGIVVVHPECAHDVVELADQVGSTDFIIRRGCKQAPPGSVIGVGTEIHLVNRLADEHPDKTIVSLDPLVCPCSTMFRIDAPHLCVGAREPRRGRRSSTRSPSTPTRPSGPGSRSSACSRSPDPPLVALSLDGEPRGATI